MSKKHTLLFVDGDVIKVVFGNKLKCIRFEDVGVDYNAAFLDEIFSTTEVVSVENVSKLTKETLFKVIGSAPPKRPEARAEAVPAKAEKRSRVSDPIMPSVQAPPAGFAPQDGGDVYIVSTDDRMTLIVDDLYTGHKVYRDGAEIEQTVILEPGKPVNLSGLDQASVKKSSAHGILGRLLRQGTVKQISFDEAMDMLAVYESRQAEVIRAGDPIGGSIIGDGSVGSARKMAQGMFSEGDDEGVLEVTGDGGETWEMSNIMSEIGRAESEKVIERPTMRTNRRRPGENR